jgi:hypothetical protein
MKCKFVIFALDINPKLMFVIMKDGAAIVNLQFP